MHRIKCLKNKIMDYVTHHVDTKSPRTKKAIALLGYSE